MAREVRLDRVNAVARHAAHDVDGRAPRDRRGQIPHRARVIAEVGLREQEDRIRAALLAIRGHEGVEGTYSFDPNADGLRGYNLVRNEGGRWVFMKRVEFQD